MTEVASTPSSSLDIDQVCAADWPLRELGNFSGRRESYFQVVFKQSVLDQIHLHGQGSAEVEICGVLVGNVYRDLRGPYLLVDHCIHGTGAASKSTNVTFTAETWQHIQATMDREHPNRKILGWYHTHPGFGIFLSDMDVFICDHFFNLPWQVAFVYDPKSGEEGNFVWRHGKPKQEPVLVVSDVTPAAARVPLITKSEAMTPEITPRVPVILREKGSEEILELRYRVHKLEKRQQLLLTALVFLTAFVAFWAVNLNPTIQQTFIVQKPTTQPAVQQAKPTTAKIRQDAKP